MNRVKTSIIAITVTCVLTGSALAVLADTASGKPFEGVVVKDVVALEQFPAEVQSGSIQVKGESEEDMATSIKLSADQAVIIAARALPGKVIEVKPAILNTNKNHCYYSTRRVLVLPV